MYDLRCVDIPVVACPAGAGPLPDVQRQFLHDRPAHRARLAARVKAVDRDHLAAVPVGLVLQLASQFAPARIRDRPGQAVGADHVPHPQVLDHDALVLRNESSRELVLSVSRTKTSPLTIVPRSEATATTWVPPRWPRLRPERWSPPGCTAPSRRWRRTSLEDIAADVENLNTVRCGTPEHEVIGVAAAARESPHGPLLSRAGASADRTAPNTESPGVCR